MDSMLALRFAAMAGLRETALSQISSRRSTTARQLHGFSMIYCTPSVINIEDTYSVTNSNQKLWLWIQPGRCLQHGQAVRLRQHEVDDQQIRFQLFQQADGANAVTSRADHGIPIRLLQGNAELPTKLFAAVCQQDPIHFFHVTTLLLVDSLISAWMYKRCF